MRTQKTWRLLAVLALATGLAACGGGGDTGFTSDPDDDDGGSGGTSPIASVALRVSNPQLLSNADAAGEGVTVTAIVRDENNNVVEDAAVTFSTSDSAAITVIAGVTDANGQATAVVTTGGDPANRSITIAGSAGSESDSVQIAVVGTTLDIQGPANTQAGTPTPYTITLTNGDGGISGQAVAVESNAGNTLSAASLTTDATGQATVTLNATAENSTLTASSLGLTATRSVTVSTDQFGFVTPSGGTATAPINLTQTLQVRWLQAGNPVPDGTVINFAATRGTLTASQATTANGIATVGISSGRAGVSTISASSPALTRPSATANLQFVSSQAALVFLNADPAVLGVAATSAITATVIDANENRVASKVVEFSLEDNSGGSLSSPVATTDQFGLARVTYTPGSVPSGQEQVVVTAVARNQDDTFANDVTRLTVTDGALRISLQTGNEIFEPNETTYQLPYVAIVTDAALNPAPGASFQVAAFPTFYFKGFYGVDSEGNIGLVTTATCANEDIDRDGILDAESGEDVNGNGILDPGNVASVPGSPALGSDGTVQFNITYGQDRGNWIQLLLTGRAAVDGSEEVERATFILPIIASDADNPPGTQYEEEERGIDANGDGAIGGRFVGSPYGISGNCDDTR